jgi:hypothetical protein
MRRTILFGAAFILAICLFVQPARGAPETYDFAGYVAGSKVLDPTVPLPEFLGPCSCPHLNPPAFHGTLVVDPALPPDQRLLKLSLISYTAQGLEVLPGHPDSRVVSLTTSQLAGNVPLPHWEIVTAVGRTAPLPAQAGRSIGISLQWSGEPGAPRQYPPGAQDVDLATLTPRTSWRMTFTLSDASAVYATSFANVVVMHRRGTGGPDYKETFDDGAALGWTPLGGRWSAAIGDLRNSTNTAFTSNTIGGLELPPEFVMLADVYLSWGASGNTAGVVFNYKGPGDFYEMRLNALGIAQLSQVLGGVRTLIHSRPYPDPGVRRWHRIYVRRAGFLGVGLLIEINGEQVFDQELFDVTEPPGAITGGTAGVFASWNLARFDNVRVGAPITGVGGALARFQPIDGNPPHFIAERGTWTGANGYMRSSTNQAVSLTVNQFPQATNVYGISGRILLEWSAAGNWGGFVYDYIDAQNYREVRFSRSVPGRVGQIVLAEVVNGLWREVYRAPRTLDSTDSELLLTLRRENDLTIVREPSFRSNIQVRQAPPTVPVRVGLLAAWNLVRFDDVIVDSVAAQQ